MCTSKLSFWRMLVVMVWIGGVSACGGSVLGTDSTADERADTNYAASGPSPEGERAGALEFAYFGDSISRVDCCVLRPEQGYLAQFVMRTDHVLSERRFDPQARDTVNFAINGSTLQHMRERLAQVLAVRRIRVVHIMSGMNQFWHMPKDQTVDHMLSAYRETLREVVQLSQAHGVHLVWSLVTPVAEPFGMQAAHFNHYCQTWAWCQTPEALSAMVRDAIRGINTVILQEGERWGFDVLDTHTPLTNAQGYLDARFVLGPDDAIHPNALAHQVLADVLLANEARIWRR